MAVTIWMEKQHGITVVHKTLNLLMIEINSGSEAFTILEAECSCQTSIAHNWQTYTDRLTPGDLCPVICIG